MIRSSVLAMLTVAMLIGAPVTALAHGTPEATPAVSCAFPPISIELLREIRDDVAENPPPTPTVATDGTWSSQMHSMPFPPPAGEPIDDATVASIKQFLENYQTCLVGGDIATLYGAWTEGMIRRKVGDNLEFVEALISAMEKDIAVFPHPGLSLLLLRAWQIDTGHVVAVVQVVGGIETWTMLLQPVEDSWRIDDLWGEPRQLLEDSLTGPVYATPIAED